MQLQKGCSHLITALLVLSMVFLHSCLKDDFDLTKLVTPSLDLDGAVPLIHSDLKMNKILPKNSLIIEDPSTGLLTLVYETQMISLKAEDYISIPDQQLSFTKDNLDIIVAPGVDISIPFEQAFTFQPPVPGQRIDSVFIKSGKINLDFISNINHNCEIIIDLPTITQNGVPFHTVIQHIYSGSVPVTGALELDFSNTVIHVNTGTGGIQEFPVHVTVTVYGDNNSNESPYAITFNTNISQLRFSKIFGYLGQYSYPLSDSLELAIFSNNFSGSIHFEDLKLMLTTHNSIGMPMQLDINEIKAFSSKNPPYMVDLIDNPLFPNPIDFLSPDINHVGQSVQSTTTFSTTNCNLNQTLDISPRFMHFEMTGKSNPAGNPADVNFILDTSRVTVLARVELPFYGSISDFAISDTLDFTFTDIDKIEEFSFIMKTQNRFPLNVELQVWLTDNQFTHIDSLIYDNNFTMLQAAPVGGPPLYQVIDDPPVPSYTYRPQVMTRERLDNLRYCKKMIIFGRLNSTNSGLVKIYSDYNLDVRIGARAKLTVN